MPYRKFLAYLKCADILRSEENFNFLDVVSYPHADKNGQKKIWRALSAFKNLIRYESGPAKYGDVISQIKRKING